MFPFGARRLVGFVGDHHEQHIGPHVAAGFFRRLHHACGGRGKGRWRVDPFAKAKVVVRMLGGEGHPGIALPGADHLHRLRRARADPAVVHGEVVTFEIAAPGAPQVTEHLDVFGEIVIAAGEIVISRPHAHLVIFRFLPAGHQIDAKPAAGDGVDSGGHPGDNRRRQRQGGGGGVDLDLRGHRGQAGHQGEGLQVVIPEFSFPAEAAQFDHGEREVEMVVLGLLHDGLIQFKGRHILRGMGGDQPAVVANGNENTNFHTYLSAVMEDGLRWCGILPLLGPPRRKGKAKAMPVL